MKLLNYIAETMKMLMPSGKSVSDKFGDVKPNNPTWYTSGTTIYGLAPEAADCEYALMTANMHFVHNADGTSPNITVWADNKSIKVCTNDLNEVVLREFCPNNDYIDCFFEKHPHIMLDDDQRNLLKEALPSSPNSRREFIDPYNHTIPAMPSPPPPPPLRNARNF